MKCQMVYWLMLLLGNSRKEGSKRMWVSKSAKLFVSGKDWTGRERLYLGVQVEDIERDRKRYTEQNGNLW